MKSARNSFLRLLNILVFSVNTDCFIKVDIYGVYRTTSMYRNQYQIITCQRIPLQEMFFTYIYGGTPTMNIILGGILYLFNAIEPI